VTIRIDVPSTASAREAAAIRLAIETLLKRAPAAEQRRSAWETAARREALDDRVH
jgi:hypothetical protein